MKLYKNLATALRSPLEVRALKLSISGEKIPSEIFQFPHLEELYLEGDCSLLGEVAGWKKLRVLSIKFRGFEDELTPLFHLPKLQNLKILETPMVTLRLPIGFITGPVESLTLKSCGLKELPLEFSQLYRLKDLNLAGNNLDTLPSSFYELKNLKRLNLDGNHFTTFPAVIKKMPSLTHLSIDQNPFSPDEKARIQREYHLWPN